MPKLTAGKKITNLAHAATCKVDGQIISSKIVVSYSNSCSAIISRVVKRCLCL